MSTFPVSLKYFMNCNWEQWCNSIIGVISWLACNQKFYEMFTAINYTSNKWHSPIQLLKQYVFHLRPEQYSNYSWQALCRKRYLKRLLSPRKQKSFLYKAIKSHYIEKQLQWNLLLVKTLMELSTHLENHSTSVAVRKTPAVVPQYLPAEAKRTGPCTSPLDISKR